MTVRCRRLFLPVAVVLLAAPLLLGATCETSAESWPGGIGAVLRHSSSEHRLVVGEVPAGTPAAAAGLRPDDEVLAIDGRPVAEMELREVVQALRGEVGTKVKLRLRRGREEFEVEVERAPYRDRS